ncbi:conserved protein of unknown function [Rhodovastum atsumiense]|uniref:Mitomycin resistance protein n=1 Tax=Rhodovastum atsumiense TaxID=504468 RepID=A0A5M6IZ15_9PROT|nr:helix-hairpin-helix domain-containing protein [Rhodovastum atsumiense]KAA5612625.1 hypothetical protein F1189_09230 [Rhodovastum atsumiense]CAH2601274.1 conserved protein of unknown function [Rhodovastum atsumiense]
MQDHVQAVSLRMQLASMPSLWRGIEDDLSALGIHSLADLRGRDPKELTAAYCARTQRPFDEFIQDVFITLVRFAEEGMAGPWWRITRRRSRERASDAAVAASQKTPHNNHNASVWAV